MGNNRSPSCFLSHLDCIEGFSQGADLVELDQNCVSSIQFNSLLDERGVRDEQIIADQLDLIAKTLTELLPAFPVILCKTIFQRDQRILLRPCFIHVDHFFRSLLAFTGTLQNILALLLIIEFRRSRVHSEADVIAELVASSLNSLSHESQRAFISERLQRSLVARNTARSIAAFITDSGVIAILLQNRLQSMEYFSTHTDSFMLILSTNRHDHVFLAVSSRISVLAAIQDVHHRNRQNLGICTADVLVQRLSVVISSSSCASQGNRQRSICTQVALERRAIEIQHNLVNLGLAGNIHADQLRSDLGVDILNSLQNSLAAETLLITITELKSFPLTGRSTRRNNCASKCTGFSGNFAFNSRVAARIENFACINTYDIRHLKFISSFDNLNTISEEPCSS